VKKKIYIVDDEPKLGELFATVLRRDGFDAQSFVSTIPMLERIDRDEVPNVILTDLMMPGLNGIELIEALKDRGLSVPVIIMTAHSSVQTAVEAMRLGAFHYLQKPVNLEEMRALLNKALDLYEAKHELEEIKSTQRATFPVTGLLGESDAIARVRETIRTLRDVPNTIVLIRGETGTGKNLVAKTIHYNSVYNAGRFMEINCAALPDNLLEAELFGYEKGAFTDARSSKPGLLEVADGGTVFLDEIDSMSVALQAKLLSFLESRTFRRLGGVEELRVTTRILCATNSNLEEVVAQRRFRKDLFFRINVVSVYLPPLRQMSRDIVEIAQEIIKNFNRDLGREVKGFTPEAEQRLLAHSWPGNVRELRNVLERAMIFAKSQLIDVPDLIITSSESIDDQQISGDMFRFPTGGTLEDLEHAYIKHILQRNNASYSDVALLLGISKKTLWDKRKRYNLDEVQHHSEMLSA
jgi:two-component system, NtrC family, response regulator AtoC